MLAWARVGVVYRVAAFDVAEPAPLLTALLTEVAATLVTMGPGGLESTIVPLIFDPAPGELGTLVGHVARGNPIVRHVLAGEALVVVTGAAGYITPSWYASKAEDGKVVPTWDYVTVQAAGPLTVHDDPAWVLNVVTRLTERHEASFGTPWAVSDAPEEYVAAMLRGIVGIEIPITRLAGKAKLSQNRPSADQDGVLAGLQALGGPAPSAATALANAITAARAGAQPEPG